MNHGNTTNQAIPGRASKLFRSFPFKTSALFDVPDLRNLQDDSGQLKEYSESLHRHETSRTYQPKEALYIFSETMREGDVSTLRPATIASVFSTVVRYCVIDTALYKDGKALLREPAVRSALADVKIPASILAKIPVDHLSASKVTRFLEKAKLTLEKISPASNEPLATNLQSEVLFNQICVRAQQKGQCNILNNIETAAFHLKYLLEGNSDLPDKKERLWDYFKQNGNGDSSKWVHIDKQELFELKAPLLMALAISPILLLSSKNLQKNPPSKEHLFNAWLLLGQYTRPECIQHAEREIWKVIWDTARGHDCFTCLTTALERISGVDFTDNTNWDPKRILEGSTTVSTPLSLPSASADQSTSKSFEGSDTTIHDRINAHWKTTISQVPAGSFPREIMAAEAADRLQRECDAEVVNDMFSGQVRPKDGEAVGGIQADDQNVARDREVSVEVGVNKGSEAKNDNEGDRVPAPEEEEEEEGVSEQAHTSGGKAVSRIQAGDQNGARDGEVSGEVGVFKGTGTNNDEGDRDLVPAEEEEEEGVFEDGHGNNDAADNEHDQNQEDQDRGGGRRTREDDKKKREDERREKEKKKMREIEEKRREKKKKMMREIEEKRREEERRRGEKKMKEEKRLKEEERRREEKKMKEEESRAEQKGKNRGGKGPSNADSSRKPIIIEVINSSSDDDTNDDDDVVCIGVKSRDVVFSKKIKLSRLTSAPKGNKHDRLKIDGGPPLLTGKAPLRSDLFSSRYASAHFKNDLKWIYGLDNANFQNKSDPEFKSSIETIEYEDYIKMNVKELHSIFASRNILVTGVPLSSARPQTYEHALQSLGRMDRELEIHDQTVALDLGGTAASYPRYRKATFSDLLQSLNMDHPKSLNALAIPSSITRPLPDHPIFTDEKAWDQRGVSLDLKDDDAGQMYPSNKMRWALAATAWASHRWHTDSDGQATHVYVDFGEKWWYIGTPKDGNPSQVEGGIRRFLDKIDLEGVNDKHLYIEAVSLDPTKYFFMRPGTFHAVVTPIPATVRGRYFYSTSTLRQTCFGIYHDFVMGNFITNDAHPRTAHSLLSCLLEFYVHTLMNDVQAQLDQVPNLTNFENFIDLMTFLHLVELRTAVHSWGYIPPEKSTPEDIKNRLMAIKDRKIGRQLKQWLFARFELLLEEKPLSVQAARSRFDHEFLAFEATALSQHKKAATKEGAKGLYDMTPDQVDGVIRLCLVGGRAYGFFLNVSKKAATRNFHWSGSLHSIKKRSEEEFRKLYACPSDEFDPRSLHWYENGYTSDDVTFMEYFKNHDEKMDVVAEASDGDPSEGEQDWRPNMKKRKAGENLSAREKRAKKS